MAAYDAFVSYSHAKDKPIAAALQSVTQTLGKPWYRRRALRVFRDDTSLSATPSLWPSIEQALGNSRFLILLASPEAAASPWVNKEVAFWLDNKSADTLLVALTDGELSWDNAVGDFAAHGSVPLPPVLSGRFATEPKWIDLRSYREGANPRDSRFIEAGADFAAAIHGMPKEDLLSQEVRQQRRALRLAWSAAGLLLALAGLAGWQWWEAERAQQIAVAAERVAVEQRENARKQRDAAEWQRSLAEQERKKAEQERGRAETNYAAARSTINSLVKDVTRGLSNVEGVRGETIARVLDTVERAVDQLAKTNADDPLLEEIRGDMYGNFSAIYMTAGERVRALQAANDRLTIVRRLSERAPSNVSYLRSMASAHVMFGYLHSIAGNNAIAETAYRESVNILRSLVARADVRDEWRIDLAFSLDKVGELRGAQNDPEGTFAAHAEALAVRRSLVAREPARTEFQFWLAVSLDRIGKLKQRAKEFEAAAEAFAESLAIARRLAARDRDSTQLQRDLALSLRSNGDLSHDRGRAEEALAAYQESLALERRLAKLDPSNVTWQRGLGVTLDRIGTVRQSIGDVEGARLAYREGRDVYRKVRAIDPRNQASNVSLIVLLSKLGSLAQAKNDEEEARAAYREWLSLCEENAAAEPNNPNWRIDMVQPLLLLARVGDNARERLMQARDILTHRKATGTLTPRQQSWLSEAERALAAAAAVDPADQQPAPQ